MGCENFFESSPEMEKLLCERLLDQEQPSSPGPHAWDYHNNRSALFDGIEEGGI